MSYVRNGKQRHYVRKHISTVKWAPATLSGACCAACAKTGGSCQSSPLGDDIGAGTVAVVIAGFVALALFYKGVL